MKCNGHELTYEYIYFSSRSIPLSTSSVSNDQDSLKSTAQAFLECLDQQDHHGRLNSTIEGITRICLREILSNYQPEVAMWNEGPWKHGNIDFQAISGINNKTLVALNHVPSTKFTPMSQSSTLQHLQGQLPGQHYGLLSQESVGVARILPEGRNPPLNQFLPGRVNYIYHPSLAYNV
jgi:hypothetical protein